MENEIIQMVNQALPVIANSTVLVKLIDGVFDVVKTLYEPRLIFRNGKAAVDVNQYEQGRLDNQGEQALTLFEINKLRNFLKAAGYAYSDIDQGENDEEYKEESIEFDWIMRFFDAVSLISNDALLQFWGKVLAGEVKNPGICSLRTLSIMRNLSTKEATDFNELCRYVMISGTMSIIFDNGFNSLVEEEDNINYNVESYQFVKEKGWNYTENISPLIEAGLISSNHDFFGDFEKENTLFIGNKSCMCYIVASDDKEPIIFQPYSLTKSGQELFQIVQSVDNFHADIDYQICCFKELKRRYGYVEYNFFKICGEDNFEKIEI